MKMHFSRTIRCSAVALALAVAATVGASLASAQVREVYNGNALDANPQVGSGNANRPVSGFVPVNGNDIINGNVGGLKYFHGRIPYSSSTEFQGNLGGSSLNNFNRQSYTGVPLGQPYTGQTTPYYTPQRQVSTDQGNYYSQQYYGSSSNRYIPGSSFSPASNVQPNARIDVTLPLNAQVTARRYNDLTANPEDINPLQPSGLFGFKSPLQVPSTDQPMDKVEKERLEAEKEKLRTDLGAKLRLGQPITTVAQPIDVAIAPIGQPEDDSAVYKRLQEQLTAKRAAIAANTARRPNNTTTAPGFQGASGVLSGKGTAETKPGGDFSLPYQSEDPTKPYYRPAASEKKPLTEQSTETLRSAKDIDPISTFKGVAGAGKGESVFDQYMRIAEKQLMDGRYLDAASTYQNAGLLSPDNPLTLMGRAHAEIAAGMYLAGAEDLQVVFEKRPEMIALRYDLKAFIPEKRLGYLLSDVSKLARDKKANPTANFALAYMDYQLGRVEDLKITLDIWKRQSPKDPWPAIFERAWLDTEKKEK